MKQILLSLISLFLIPSMLFAQPEPCGEIPVMTPFCVDACIICDIDGFTGINNAGVGGEAPPGFCTTTVHNGRWIAFIAGSENLVIELAVSNCQTGWGLELGIYEGIDCDNFQLVSNCDGSVDNNSVGVFENTQPLTIGQYYYIVMDGNGGDVCNWTFTVREGSTQVSPLTTSGVVSGEFYTCPDVARTYSTTPQVGATTYEWMIDGVFEGEGENIDISWAGNGTYQLCVTASNVCDEAPPSCQTVVVQGILPISFNEVICTGEEFIVNDTIMLSTTGFYEYHFTTAEGCDSAVFVTLEVIESTFTNYTISICEGDSIYIGNVPFFEAGQYVEILPNENGCDSTVTLDLSILICEIEGETTPTPVVCFGESTGEIAFTIENGTPPFDYTWQQIDGTPSGTGSVTNLNEIETISNLPAGLYLITINDQIGNDAVLIETITEPPLLTATLTSSEYNGEDISCFGAADGSLEAVATGGVSPYQYSWNTGAATAQITDLLAGAYNLMITDAYGCVISLNESLTEPNALLLEVLATNPTCDGFDSGEIAIQSMSGGAGSYLFEYGNQGFSMDSIFSELFGGTYTITAQDANGCEVDTTVTLVTPIIPVIDLGEDLTINLGEETNLFIEANVILDSVLWSPTTNLSCPNCPEITATPFVTTTYYATVVSPDDCATTDSITIMVDERRRVYAPNAFTPNWDGINDWFTIYGGSEVAQIKTFQVFSRWGELLYKGEDLPINGINVGWDGLFRGKMMPTGVYTWTAEVEFLDGVVFLYYGDVTIVK